MISAFTAVAVLGSGFLSTNAFAQESDSSINELKKHQIVNYLKDRGSATQTPSISSASAQAASTQMQYQKAIDAYQFHEYHFSTYGGNFSLEELHQEKDEVDYFIYEFDTEELVEPGADNNYNLDEGDYVLVVMGYSEQPVTYDYILNGPFAGDPANAIPDLLVNNPSNHESRLNKGSSPILTVSGETKNSQIVRIFSNQKEYNVYPGKFTQQVELAKGFNTVSFQATNSKGNTITSFYSITLPGISRIYGKDRYHVSGHVSSTLDYWGYNSGTIIITRGDLFPDALSGGPLANLETAPVMLTTTKTLPDKIKEKIVDYGANRAIILGGTGSVSTEVESQLKKLGVNEIERIGGKDRFAVSASVAEYVSSYTEFDTAIIASGEVFPDALSASTIAGPAGMPILLVKSQEVPATIQAFIKSHPEIKNFIVVGGPATVKDSVSVKLKELRKGANVQRIGGKDRYEVAINVAKYGMNNYGMDLSTVAFARGDLFPDALSGAPLANYFYAPILLTRTEKVEDKVNAFLTNHRSELEHMYLIGDIGSISPNTEKQLYNLIR